MTQPAPLQVLQHLYEALNEPVETPIATVLARVVKWRLNATRYEKLRRLTTAEYTLLRAMAAANPLTTSIDSLVDQLPNR